MDVNTLKTNTENECFSVVSYTFQGGNGSRTLLHSGKFETKSDYDELVSFIKKDDDGNILNPDTLIVTNILTFKNQ